jgi:hypothetical protein
MLVARCPHRQAAIVGARPALAPRHGLREATDRCGSRTRSGCRCRIRSRCRIRTSDRGKQVDVIRPQSGLQLHQPRLHDGKLPGVLGELLLDLAKAASHLAGETMGALLDRSEPVVGVAGAADEGIEPQAHEP